MLMDAWDDLFRSGIVGYGMDVTNLGMNWSHLTAFGAEALRDLDRDPSNPTAYLAVVEPFIKDEPFAASYLAEALSTYNKGRVACIAGR